MKRRLDRTGKPYRRPPPESSLTIVRRGFLEAIWNMFYAPVVRFYATELEKYLPTKIPEAVFGSELVASDKVYAFFHKGMVVRVHKGANPEQLRDYPAANLTIVMTNTVTPEELPKFEQALLNYVDLTAEYLAVINFFRGFVLFPISKKTLSKDGPLGETITRKLEKPLRDLHYFGDPQERTPLAEEVLDEFIGDHDDILNRFADRILENMLLGALIRD